MIYLQNHAQTTLPIASIYSLSFSGPPLIYDGSITMGSSLSFLNIENLNLIGPSGVLILSMTISGL